MVLLFVARSNSYKTRRQLMHCRIDVVTTRRNVVVNPSYLVQNSQTTRVLSYRCRNYSKKCSSKPVISWHYTVLCRSKSNGTRNNSHYVAMVDRRSRTRDKSRNVYDTVRQSTGELRDQHEKSSAHFGWRVVARFFPTMYEIWRHATRTADMGRHLFDFPSTCGEFLTRRMS